MGLIDAAEGMDKERLQLEASHKFWKLIAKQRSQRTMSRAELERRIKTRSERTGGFGKGNVY